MLYNALSMRKETTKMALFDWDCVTPPEEDRAMAIGSMHEKLGKDCACGSRDMLTDKHTDVLITILSHRSLL